MKVLDLRCGQGHGFEGWFASEDDFQTQLADGRLECPLCADRAITKQLSAPRLNLSGARAPTAPPAAPHDARAQAPGAGPAPAQPAAAAPATADGPAAPAALQALWLQAVQHVLKNTEDVGERFPEEARRIHYGETEQRGIRGLASPEERAALADEGIEVAALPLPAGLKGPVQ
ncbi:DUF1178 family protein [Ideonella sp. DXS22W]|uniref:DUF1178 family protein n=1 Tax=Pseudaquabacterium inlustre TaxID=2984192 RepID=A0ABU9CKM6_9BURK